MDLAAVLQVLRQIPRQARQGSRGVAVHRPIEVVVFHHEPGWGVPEEVLVVGPQRGGHGPLDLPPDLRQQAPDGVLELVLAERGVRQEDVVRVDLLVLIELVVKAVAAQALVLPAKVVADFLVELLASGDPVVVRRRTDDQREEVVLLGDLVEPPVQHGRLPAGLVTLADLAGAPGVEARMRRLEEMLALAIAFQRLLLIAFFLN
jgi:hypothetical protein